MTTTMSMAATMITMTMMTMTTIMKKMSTTATRSKTTRHIWTSPKNAVVLCRAVCDAEGHRKRANP